MTGTQVDTQLAGDQTDLVKGNTYTWTGYVNVPAADTWTFVLSGPQAPWWGTRPGLTVASTPGIRTSVRGHRTYICRALVETGNAGWCFRSHPVRTRAPADDSLVEIVLHIPDVAERQLRSFAVLFRLPEDRQWERAARTPRPFLGPARPRRREHVDGPST